MATPTSPRRAYRGMSADQRRALRRRALLEAAREVWCEQGWAGVTMRGVCAHAGLSDRYFYENFADRDVLLVEVGRMVRDETIALLVAAIAARSDAQPREQLRAAIAAIVEFVANDPGNAQIFFGDHGGSEALGELRRDIIDSVVGLFLGLTRPRLLPGASDDDLRIALLVGIGGFVETVTAWRSGLLDVTADQLVETLMGVSERLGDGIVEAEE